MPRLRICSTYLHAYVVRMLGGEPSGAWNSTVLVVAAASAVVAVLLCMRVYSIGPNFRKYDPDEFGSRFRGIQGPLILVGIAVFLEPLHVLLDTLCSLYLDHLSVWQSMVTDAPRGSWFGCYIAFTGAMLVVRVAFAYTIALAFVNRRRIFRSITIGYMAGLVIIGIIDDFLLSQYLNTHHMALVENFEGMMRTLQFTLIVLPYFLFSRRIHATFRN